MINATENGFVPGMSAEMFTRMYGYDALKKVAQDIDTLVCRPLEDVVFNDEQYFLKSETYMCLEELRYYIYREGIDIPLRFFRVYNVIGTEPNGFIYLNEDRFNKYFKLIGRK